MIVFALGVITGVLLAMVAMVANKIGVFVKKIPQKLKNQQAIIVNTKNPIDEIDL